MKPKLKAPSIIIAWVFISLFSGAVTATPIAGTLCASTDDARYMGLQASEGSTICAGSGTGMTANKNFHEALGLGEIEKLEGSPSDLIGNWFSVKGLNGTEGSINFFGDIYNQYSDIHVVFKFGNKKIIPDWISYSIEGVLSADWEVTGSQALSNVAVWGHRKTVEVPEPGTLGLLGLGLIGLFATIRRRNSIT